MEDRLNSHPDHARDVTAKDILRKTINQDAPIIAGSFDQFCGAELAIIDEVFSAAALVLLSGLRRADQDRSSIHKDDGQPALHYGLRANCLNPVDPVGYPLSVGVIARNVLETIATVLHLGANPSDLERFLRGDLESSKTFSTAKKVLPSLGAMNGLLSNQFVHLGRLYTEPQPYRPYESRREGGLDTALVILKTSVWLFYETAELTFYDVVEKPRYWRRAGAKSDGQTWFAYDPFGYGTQMGGGISRPKGGSNVIELNF